MFAINNVSPYCLLLKKNKKEPTPVIKFAYSVNLINKLYAFPLACKKTERQSKTVYVYACCTKLRILE